MSDIAFLRNALQVAVPLWIEEMRPWSYSERRMEAERALSIILEHGDSIIYPRPHTAKAFTALAKALAVAAFQPGGVDFFGLHFEAGDG